MHCDASFYLYLASAGGTDIYHQISRFKQHIKFKKKHINSSVLKEIAKINTGKRHSKLGPNISQLHTLSPYMYIGFCQSIEWP